MINNKAVSIVDMTKQRKPYRSDIGAHIRACAPPASSAHPLRVLVIQGVRNLEHIEKNLQKANYPTITCKDTPDIGFRDRLDVVYSAPEESIINVLNFDILLSDDCETLSYVREKVKDKKIICVFYTKSTNIDNSKNLSKMIGNYNINIKFMNEGDFISEKSEHSDSSIDADFEMINSIISILENNGFKSPVDTNVINPTIRLIIDTIKLQLISVAAPKNKLKPKDVNPSRLWVNRAPDEKLFDFIRDVYKEWIGNGLIISYFKEIDEPLYREIYKIIYRKKIQLPNDLLVLKNHEKPLNDISDYAIGSARTILTAKSNYYNRKKRAEARLAASPH